MAGDRVTGRLRVHPDAPALARAAADLFVDIGRRAVDAAGRFTVALSGGSTPRAMFRELAGRGGELDWNRVELFWGDERMVPPDDEDSNFRTARELLIEPLGLARERVHRVPTERGEPAAVAAAYESTLRTVFALGPRQVPAFDLVLLGLGEDGHTASLFPGTAALAVDDRLVAANRVERLSTWRITLTFPVLDNAAHAAFLVQGERKTDILRRVLGADEGLPAQRVRPRGALEWLVDAAAAGGAER